MNPSLFAWLSQPPYAFALAAALLVTGVLVTRVGFTARPYLRLIIRISFFSVFTVVLAGAGVAPTEPTPEGNDKLSLFAISGFKLAWWITAAWLVVGLLRAGLVFKRLPRETVFLQDTVVGAIYICAALGIVADVFDIPVTGLLAASGVVAIVLGLALQSTLGDVLSGIVLNLSKPYHLGDWVILDGGLVGQVIEINWRATHFLTANNDVAIVPNSMVVRRHLGVRIWRLFRIKPSIVRIVPSNILTIDG